MTLAELNAFDRERFTGAIGWVFEHSPWVAERAWAHRPFATVEALHASMVREVERSTLAERLALLRAHPDLGTRARMSEASTGEQASAGLDNLSRDEFERLGRLNASYREKFDFPFLYAVKGSTTQNILDALERRLASGRDQELDEALRQVARIARFRLDDAIDVINVTKEQP